MENNEFEFENLFLLIDSGKKGTHTKKFSSEATTQMNRDTPSRLKFSFLELLLLEIHKESSKNGK